MGIKSYSELVRLPTFSERLEYLQLSGKVASETFGKDRILNQVLYHGYNWKRLKDQIICRDMGCDLAIESLPIHDRVYIHHINPITKEDVLDKNPKVLDPENLICCSFNTHQMIHYGYIAKNVYVERSPNDTAPWRIT